MMVGVMVLPLFVFVGQPRRCNSHDGNEIASTNKTKQRIKTKGGIDSWTNTNNGSSVLLVVGFQATTLSPKLAIENWQSSSPCVVFQ